MPTAVRALNGDLLMDALGQPPASTPDTRAAIAMALVKKGGEFLRDDQPQRALAAYRHARDILDGLSASQRDNTDLGLTLSLVYRKIGDAMCAQGDPDGAKDAYLSSLAIIEGLAKFHPDNAELLRHRAEALAALSAVSDARGSPSDNVKELAPPLTSLREALARIGEAGCGLSATDGGTGCRTSSAGDAGCGGAAPVEK
jgi:hypothetical protein